MYTYKPYVFIDGQWKRCKTHIGLVTNMGPIPANALLTNSGEPYLTNSKEYILLAGSGYGADGTDDYILYENLPYKIYIGR